MPPEVATETPTTPSNSGVPETPPVDTTTSAPGPSTEGQDAEQNDLFAGFDFGSMDFADQPSSETEPSSQEPTEQIKQVETPAAPAATAPKPTEAAPVAPPASQTPAPAAQQTPVETPPDQAQIQAALVEHQTKALKALEEYYKIDDKLAERFEQEPTKVLTEMLSRAHLAILNNAYQAVLKQLPQVTEATISQVKTHQDAEDTFYKAWPMFDRKNTEQVKVLQTYGQLFRQQNPTASAEEFTKFVGAAAAAHLGLKSKPKTGTNGRRPVPHNPAAAGGGAPPASGAEPQLTQAEEMFAVYQSGKA